MLNINMFRILSINRQLYFIFLLLLLCNNIPIKAEEKENKKLDKIQQLLNTNSCINCDLREVDLSGKSLINANLQGADLRQAKLIGTDLKGAFLYGAKLCNADLINADLRGANLSLANLSRADLTYANLGKVVYPALVEKNSQEENEDKKIREFDRTKLFGTILREAELDDANLEEAFLTSADLSGVSLRRANLTNADLSYAKINKADLSGIFGADLYNLSLMGNIGANLEGALLIGSDLSGSDLRGANLRNANIEKTNFSNALLSRSIKPEGNIDSQSDPKTPFPFTVGVVGVDRDCTPNKQSNLLSR